MKIDEEMRFPHPVLWAESGDYSVGEFSAALEVQEVPSTGAVKIRCNVSLTEPALVACLTSGKAEIGLFVVCLDTYFNSLVRPSFPIGEIDIPAGQLRGQVTFRPIFWAKSQISSFVSPNVHQEFGSGPLAFGSADVLAIGEEVVINVGSDKLAPIASVFELVLNDDVDLNRVSVQVDSERIQINANQATLQKISQLRNTSAGRALLLNSLYLPAVMEVIAAMRADADTYEARRWFRVFEAKLDHLGITSGTEVLEAAQTLLKSPFGRLDSYLEGGR